MRRRWWQQSSGLVIPEIPLSLESFLAASAALSGTPTIASGLSVSSALAGSGAAAGTPSIQTVFSPLNLTGCQYLAVADDTVDDGSGNIASLTDRKNGLVFTPTGSPYTLNTTAKPGHVVLECASNTQQIDEVAATQAQALGGTSDATFWIYYKRNSVTGSCNWIVHSDGTANQRISCQDLSGASAGGTGQRANNSQGAIVNTNVSGWTETNTSWHSIFFKWRNSNGRWYVNFDGTEVGNAAASAVRTPSGMTTIALQGPPGVLGVWAAFSSELSTSDCANCHAWANTEYS